MTGDSSDSVLAVLEGLTPTERILVGRAGRRVTFGKGQRLFREGEPAERCWLIRSGAVALETSTTGADVEVVQVLGAGDILGWSWLVPPYRWHLGARAVDTVEALELDAVQLRALADQDPRFGYTLARQVLHMLLDRLQATRALLVDARSPRPVGRTSGATTQSTAPCREAAGR